MKLILSLLLTISATFAVDTRGLSEVQEAELALQVAKMKTVIPATSTVDTVIESASKFNKLGVEIGTAIRSSLEAVSDIANKFADTPVGTITIGLVIWHLIGADLVKLLLGIIILWSSIKFFKRLTFTTKLVTKTTYVPYFWGLFSLSRPETFKYEETSSDSKFGGAIILLIGTIVSIVLFGNIG